MTALCGVVAGVAHAQDYLPVSGTWNTPANWNGGALPTGGAGTGNARIRDLNTVTLAIPGALGNNLWLGAGAGADRSGTLTILPGGTLSLSGQTFVGGSGGITTGTLNINAGGTLQGSDIVFMGRDNATGFATVDGTWNTGGALWMGVQGAGAGTLMINDGGIVTVNGQLGLGWQAGPGNTGGSGTIVVADGGQLSLLTPWNNANSIQAGSVMNINLGGTVIASGNKVTSANDYFTTGRIATDGTGISATYDSGSNTTTIVAIPEPATLGMVVAFGGALLFIRRKMVI